MYASGKGTQVDKANAYAWLAMSVKGGVVQAQEELSKLAEKMTLAETARAKQLIIDYNKMLDDPNAKITSESMNENLGNMAFKAQPKSFSGYRATTTIKLDNQTNGGYYDTSSSRSTSTPARKARTVRRR